MAGLPETSNFYATLQSDRSARQVAAVYRDAGWAMRACGWEEFEVTSEVAELVIAAKPVLVHGAVAEPLVNLDAVLAPLVANGITYSCECYAPDGSLVEQRTGSGSAPRTSG